MIPPDKLTDLFSDVVRKWRALGPSTVQRFADWEQAPHHTTDERGGGGAPTDNKIRDLLGDRQAAAYLAELRALTDRLSSDMHRLLRLVEIAHPDQPRVLRLRDLSESQLVADGWCPSCFRDDGHLAPIAEGRYASRCRLCGEHKAATGKDPSPEELRIMHSRGKRLRQRTA